MYIHKIKKGTYLLRESFRDGRKVRHRTYVNLSRWSSEKIEELARALKAWRAGGDGAGHRILHLLYEHDSFRLQVIRRGKDSEKWLYFAADPYIEFQVRISLGYKRYRRKMLGLAG